jgi:hypothetical protein
MKGRVFAALTIGLVAVLAAPAWAAVVGGGDQGGRPLTATLDGPSEVPPGDPDGTGTALVSLNQGTGDVCYELTWENIEEPTAAHIHEAEAGVPGPIVVPLTVDPPQGCVQADAELIQAIRNDPAAYYVNIHNETFMPGAIRGQLEK